MHNLLDVKFHHIRNTSWLISADFVEDFAATIVFPNVRLSIHMATVNVLMWILPKKKAYLLNAK